VTDLKSVLDQSIRIIQAMIDICANSGWLMSALACMHLLQMIMQVHNPSERFYFTSIHTCVLLAYQNRLIGNAITDLRLHFMLRFVV
jgi:Sec63 Brl domain